MTRRLFIAPELPPSCCDRLVSLSTPRRGVRWLEAAHLHLTLARLAEVSAPALRPFLKRHEHEDFC